MRHLRRFTALAALPAGLIALSSPALASNLRHHHALLKSTPLVGGHDDLPFIIAENKALLADVDGYEGSSISTFLSRLFDSLGCQVPAFLLASPS